MSEKPRFPPLNDRIDYERAGAFEATVREAAQKYGFTVISILIGSGAYSSAPEISITLKQQPRERNG